MIGPGNSGPYDGIGYLNSPEFENACINGGENVVSARRYVRIFVEELADGDIVVLKRGRKSVRGVGIVVGRYLYYPNFGNDMFPRISGWNVCHCRRVRWLWSGNQVFNGNFLSCDRLSRVYDGRILDWLRTIGYHESQMTVPLSVLPA